MLVTAVSEALTYLSLLPRPGPMTAKRTIYARPSLDGVIVHDADHPISIRRMKTSYHHRPPCSSMISLALRGSFAGQGRYISISSIHRSIGRRPGWPSNKSPTGKARISAQSRSSFLALRAFSSSSEASGIVSPAAQASSICARWFCRSVCASMWLASRLAWFRRARSRR